MYAYVYEGKRHDAGDKLGFLKATVEFALKREDLAGPSGVFERIEAGLTPTMVGTAALGRPAERSSAVKPCSSNYISKSVSFRGDLSRRNLLFLDKAGSSRPRRFRNGRSFGSASLQLSRLLFHALGQLLFVRVELLRDRRIRHSENLRRKNSGIGCSRLTNCDRRDRDACGHLDCCQQGVHTVE